MPNPVHFAGNLAHVGVNGTVYQGNKGWNIDNDGEEKRTDSTAGNGYSDREVTMRDLKATIDGDWDASQNLLDDPPKFVVGQILTNVKLFLNGSTSPFWSLPSAIVLKVGNNAQVGDIVKYTINIANKGAFSPPTGTFTPITPGT